MLLRCISIQTEPYSLQSKWITTLYLFLVSQLRKTVAGGQGAAATQSGNQEQRNKDGTGHAQPSHGTRQEQNRSNSHCGASQHLRKARLLNSEAWTESETQRRSAPSVAINGQSEEHNSGHSGTSQDKGESTLLASLLQSFSSRLQNVTLPQQIIQGLRPLDAPCQVSKPAQEERADVPCHGPALSHLKGLVSKSKMHNQSNSVPYQRRRSSQESFSESPKALQSSTPSPSPESLSCTERLKAVANLVNIRSSPAPSPKPSVACSQLALLLSSEAHLQEYSREHALKAQLLGRSASERLSAMATQQTQDKQPTTSGLTHGLSLLHTKNGILSQMSTSSSRQSPSLTSGQRTEGSMRTGHCFRERRPFEKQGRPSQNCSSLLLQLLNSHNTSQRINGQGHLRDDISTFGTLSSPLFSDSEHSNPDSSLTKDSSDAESSYSSCSPIDLSLKTRTNVQTPVSTSSSPVRDRVPESLLNRWKYESPPVKVTSDHREVDTCSEMKSHHKVTLLQLLLDHKNSERANKGLDNPDLQQAVIPKNYYGSWLETSDDLQTNAACVMPSRPLLKSACEALKQVHPDVCKRYFGCGLVIPEKLEGCTVLDLGSGSGRDCYVLSKLVGERGRVIGLDMTDEMIVASQKYVQYHQEQFGYSKPNTVFVKGYMEKLNDAGIQNNSLDVVVYAHS
ncbi:hypothetical protein cypCar_00027044 [Cyprinus carpio]|nr:hypothetical protein cypCar_00027044 [Cyprinus carpio]